LNVDALDEIPSKTGVYKFFNEDNQLIYIGKSKQIRTRIDQHLRNTSSKKGMQMMKEISRIEYELTGSELIALMLESQLIKQHRPLFNRQLTKSRFPFGIYDTISGKGYLQLEIERTAKKESIPLISFTTRVEASKYLEYICEQYELCQKLCSLYPTQSSCFHYEIKKCKGACIEAETTTEYNERAQSLIDKLTFSGESFYVIDKGRNKGEKSLVLVERGLICGFGYAPFHFQNQPVYKWSRFIEHTKEDRDARTILNQFLKKNSEIQVIRF
jgi:DNA polymerase-3 subunit epsilon